MAIFNISVNDLFGRIENQTHIIFNISPIGLNLRDSKGEYEGWFGFYRNSAVRIDTSGNNIRGVAIWTSPGSLNSPQYYIDAQSIDILGEVDTISKLLFDKKNSMFESNGKNDVELFMSTLGNYGINKKISQLYQSYEPWAGVNNKELLPFDIFAQLSKSWLLKNKKGAYTDFKVDSNKSDESTVVSSAEELDFNSKIINNEDYYRATLFEQSIKLMAKDDPIINSIYLCGTESSIILDKIKKILHDNKVEDNEILIKNKNIQGFASLLEFLWDNRRNKYLILKDCDKLLKKGTKTSKIIKSILETEEKYRLVNYSYSEEEDEEEEDDNGKN